MNLILNTVAVLAVAGVMTSGTTAFAADINTTNHTHTAKGKGVEGAAKMKEMTLTGIVAQKEIQVAGKNYTVFELITESGAKLHLPTAKAGKKAAAAPMIQLADYVGKNVKVVAMGSERTKGDKTVLHLKTLKSIEMAPAAGTAPAKMV